MGTSVLSTVTNSVRGEMKHQHIVTVDTLLLVTVILVVREVTGLRVETYCEEDYPRVTTYPEETGQSTESAESTESATTACTENTDCPDFENCLKASPQLQGFCF